MVPDPRILAFLASVVSGGPEGVLGDPPPSPLQAEAVDAAPGQGPAAGDAAPPAPEGPAGETTTPPETPPAESPSTDSPAGEPSAAPVEGEAAFPDVVPADAATPEPAPAAEETRTWNDPEAAVAAAAAAPATPGASPVEDELGDKPLPPVPGKDPEGFGMAMVGAITISPDSGHQWSDGQCPPPITINGQTFAPGCGATPPAGVSAEGRFGYMWGLFGAELYGQLATDYLNASLTQVPNIPNVPSYATQMHIGRLGIGGGAHARFKSPPGPFRLSAGAGGGFLYRTIFSNVSSLDGSFEDYVAPVLRADVGIVIVSALTLGIMGWIEFAETVTVSPDFSSVPGGEELEQILGSTVAYRGTQGFFGVFGGFAFGK